MRARSPSFAAEPGSGYQLRTTDDGRAKNVCLAQPGIEEVSEARDTELTFTASDEQAVAALSIALAESGAPVLKLAPRPATLEDLFFELTEGDGAERAARTRQLIEEMA